jgi:outer membrane receptor for ferrienterochelin and colicin
MNQGVKSMKLFSRLTALMLAMVLSLNAANYGKIAGQITAKKDGAPIPGANIMLEGTALGAASDEQGNFIIIQIPPGEYTLRVMVIGYENTAITGIPVNPDRITYQNISLGETVLGMEEVTVVAEREIIEKDIAATSRNVSGENLDILPGTSVGDAIRTQPGAINSGGLHFRGGRSGEVTYYLDGVPLVDPLFNDMNSSEVINRDAIANLQVISGTFSAEYGNAMSGIINITTQDGSDRLKGKIDLKSTMLSVEENSTNYNRNVARVSLSGPLLPGKTFFFASGSWDDRDSYLPWGYRTQSNLFVKITDKHLSKTKLKFGLNMTQGQYKNYSHAYKYIPEMYWYEPRTNSLMSSFEITHSLSAAAYFNLMIYNYGNHYDSGDFSYDSLSSAYSLDANKEFYTKSFVSSWEEDEQQTLGVKGDFLWQMNQYNELKAGFDLRWLTIDRFYVNAPYYNDHLLDSYVRQPREMAFFIQDKIHFSNIILSAGLRYDLNDPASDYWTQPFAVENGDSSELKSADIHSQLSPRLGISYPVSDKTVFHFGYGHYFQRPEYQFIYRMQADENAPTLTDKNGDGVIDYRDNMLMSLYSGNGRYGNPNLLPEKTIMYEFGLSHLLGNDFLMSLSVYSKRITQLLGTRTYFPYDLPGWYETVTLHINEDFAYNNGVEIQLQKMRGKYLTGEINYTYAVAEGSSSGPLERVGAEEASRQTLKFFPLSFDQRHTVNGSLTGFYEGFMGTLIFQWGSGLPYTKGMRGATDPYEINNMRKPVTWTLDLKLDYTVNMRHYRLIPYLEIYNLTDRKNVNYVDPFTGEPDESTDTNASYEYIANPLNWDAPRLIYLGVNLKF